MSCVTYRPYSLYSTIKSATFCYVSEQILLSRHRTTKRGLLAKNIQALCIDLETGALSMRLKATLRDVISHVYVRTWRTQPSKGNHGQIYYTACRKVTISSYLYLKSVISKYQIHNPLVSVFKERNIEVSQSARICI